MEEDGWKAFIEICVRSTSKKELTDLFDLFFTNEEKVVFGARLQVVRELLKGELPQREIAKKLQVSISQITRGSNALKEANSKIKSLLSR